MQDKVLEKLSKKVERYKDRQISDVDYGKMLEAVGFTPDEWQLKIVELAESFPVAGVSIPRQNGKSELALMLLMITGLRGEIGAFFGHNGDVARTMLRRMGQICQPLIKEGIVKAVRTNNYTNLIDFTSGGIIYFRIRSTNAAVGMTFDRIVFDEAQKMDDQSYEDIVPTTTNSKHSSIILIGTPPTNDDLKLGTTPFIRLREAAKGRTEETGWVEYGIGDYTPHHKRYNLYDAKHTNPAWKRIPNFPAMIKEQQKLLDAEAFARQRLGAWVLPNTLYAHDPILTVPEVQNALSKHAPEGRLIAGVGIGGTGDSAWVAFSDGIHEEVAGDPRGGAFDISGGNIGDITSALINAARRYAIVMIPNNDRGRAIASALKEARMGKKVRMVTATSFATKERLFISKLRDGTIKVYENDDAYAGLSSFWIGYDKASNSMTVECNDDSLKQVVSALVICVHDGALSAAANAAESKVF